MNQDFEYFTTTYWCEERRGGDFSTFPRCKEAAWREARAKGFPVLHRELENYNFTYRSYEYTFTFRRMSQND